MPYKILHHSFMTFKKLVFAFLFSASIFSFQYTVAQEKTCDISIEIKGLKNTDGQIMISINRGPEGWPEENFIEQRFIPTFTAPNYTVVFKDMPYGNYAVGVLHDKDKNGEMTKNFIGIPKEAYGFTRDYKVVFRAPHYEEANFEANTPKLTLEVNLQD
jgi:uncharacterized protein (DUF2141 family)